MCLKQRQRETDWETYWNTHIQGDSGKKSNTQREAEGERHTRRDRERESDQPTDRDKWTEIRKTWSQMKSGEREREKREPTKCTGRETVRLRDGWGAKKKVRKRESVTDIETDRRTDPERNWKRERRGRKGEEAEREGEGGGEITNK